MLPISTQTQGGALPTYPLILPLDCTKTGHRAIILHCCRDDVNLTMPIAGPAAHFGYHAHRLMSGLRAVIFTL
jgi:hypothetical protein